MTATTMAMNITIKTTMYILGREAHPACAEAPHPTIKFDVPEEFEYPDIAEVLLNPVMTPGAVACTRIDITYRAITASISPLNAVPSILLFISVSFPPINIKKSCQDLQGIS
jgi:hypothetical protein